LDAVNDLFQALYHLQNILNELKCYVDLVNDESTSKSAIQKNSRNIKQFIFPAIEKIADIIQRSSKQVVHIPSLKVACDSRERQSMKAIVDPSNKRKTVDLQVLQNYELCHTK
jgi:hypothetical protein